MIMPAFRHTIFPDHEHAPDESIESHIERVHGVALVDLPLPEVRSEVERWFADGGSTGDTERDAYILWHVAVHQRAIREAGCEIEC